MRAVFVAAGVASFVALAGCSAIWGFHDVSLEGDGGNVGGGDSATSSDGGPGSDGAQSDSPASGDGPVTGETGPEGAPGPEGSTGDGGPELLAVALPSPEDIAVDSTYVYYTILGSNTIVRSGKDGTGSVTVAKQPEVIVPYTVVSDGTSFYFADETSTGSLYSCPASGCISPVTPLEAENESFGIAVASGTLFWTSSNDGTVSSASAASGGAAQVLFNQTGTAPFRLVVDGTNVYFTDIYGPVRRLETGGATVIDLTASSEPASSIALAVGATSVFFTIATTSTSTGDSIWSVPRNGTQLDTSFAGALDGCDGIAADATDVYWLNRGAENAATGTLATCPQTGCNGSPKTLATGLHYPVHIAIDADYVYWTNAGLTSASGPDGSVMRIHKP
jgi:hypothetical protein